MKNIIWYGEEEENESWAAYWEKKEFEWDKQFEEMRDNATE